MLTYITPTFKQPHKHETIAIGQIINVIGSLTELSLDMKEAETIIKPTTLNGIDNTKHVNINFGNPKEKYMGVFSTIKKTPPGTRQNDKIVKTPNALNRRPSFSKILTISSFINTKSFANALSEQWFVC